MAHPEYENVGDSDPFNRMVEEIGELLMAIGKARRFGWFSRNPKKPESLNNVQQIRLEINDLRIQLDRAEQCLDHMERDDEAFKQLIKT